MGLEAGSDRSITEDIAAIGRMQAVPRILQAVAHLTGQRFAAVARVTDTKWTACAVHDEMNFGLQPGGELALETTICNEIRDHRQPVIFGHASAHPVFATHHTPRQYGFESYISIPIITRDGEFFGTLCAIDPAPAKLDDPNLVRTLSLFAQLIAAQLEHERRLVHTEGALTDALDTGTLREQFLAVVGHDLRSPLQAMKLGTATLKAAPTPARAERVIALMENSIGRMGRLIEDIMDFARGRLGGGIPVALQTAVDLQDMLDGVVAEVRAAHPERNIVAAFDVPHAVACDPSRIAQLFTNLLANAAVHGAVGEPIRVTASTRENRFELSVANGGEPINADDLQRLFEPFSRPHADEPREGLGLGLYIAAQIAKAHRGTLSVTSSHADGTRFTLHMPLA